MRAVAASSGSSREKFGDLTSQSLHESRPGLEDRAGVVVLDEETREFGGRLLRLDVLVHQRAERGQGSVVEPDARVGDADVEAHDGEAVVRSGEAGHGHPPPEDEGLADRAFGEVETPELHRGVTAVLERHGGVEHVAIQRRCAGVLPSRDRTYAR